MLSWRDNLEARMPGYRNRIVHITHGVEFLGYKIQRGKGKFKLTRDRIKSTLNRQNLYAIPTQKSVDRFKIRSGPGPRGTRLYEWVS